MKPELRTWDLFWPCTYFFSNTFLFYTNIFFFSFDISPSTNNFFTNLLQEIPFRYSFHLAFFVHVLRSTTGKKWPNSRPCVAPRPCPRTVHAADEHLSGRWRWRFSCVSSCLSLNKKMTVPEAKWRKTYGLTKIKNARKKFCKKSRTDKKLPLSTFTKQPCSLNIFRPSTVPLRIHLCHPAASKQWRSWGARRSLPTR